MPRAVAYHPPPEMAVLGLIEFMLSFAVFYTVIHATGTVVTPPGKLEMLSRDAAATAVVLTLISGSVAMTIGLYRPEVCLDRKRLLIATGIAAAVAFALLLLFSDGPGNSLTTVHAL